MRTVGTTIACAVAGFVLACVWASATADKRATATERAPAPAGWKLVWSDEFDKPGLPDPNKWDYEVGYVRNNELQYYTRARKENARVEGGCLVIEGRKEKYPIGGAKSGDKAGAKRFADYTAASLITRGKAQWTFGRIEVRAKLPQGKGVWPAFWMLGQKFPSNPWPACGEIDIMEFVGHTPDKVHATVHYRKDGKHAFMGGKLTVDRPFDDFHIYAVEWSAERMNFFFDARKYFTFEVADAADAGSNPFHKPQYLLINLALGGAWGREMDDSVLPQKYLIDHVRVYQRTPAGGGRDTVASGVGAVFSPCVTRDLSSHTCCPPGTLDIASAGAEDIVSIKFRSPDREASGWNDKVDAKRIQIGGSSDRP